MTHYSSPEDGSIGEAELDYIERRSAGPGLVFTACVAVSPNGKAYIGEPAAHDDSLLPGLAAWAERIKGAGAKAILQLHHGGGVCPPALVPDGDVVSPAASLRRTAALRFPARLPMPKSATLSGASDLRQNGRSKPVSTASKFTAAMVI
nr:hypothetical protein [Marinicella sp. W31]MDC2875522.1 hypothetical protein [Marinicella sp. W31]